ncbi:MAG: DEAD/DEAH box helicase [candidate division Zixibacteria bacterium]|nr:DEAD/DEAH box helicase [candidate division Zixibacteria bacterium]
MNDLSRWGIPERIIDVWRRRQGEILLPVQQQALKKGLLNAADGEKGEPGMRLVISAPTSSGKSFCAEMAMVRALTSRLKTVMLFPLKSLAEETYRVFSRTYGPLGVKCLIATGDHPENDRSFREGDYHVAIAVYEKFDLLLTDALDILKNIGLVVIDEIQTVSEPGRGAVLERMLTKILASVYAPSLIGLSAVIGDGDAAAGRLAGWLGASLVEHNSRPVDLMRGVAADGSFCFRSYNDGTDGREPFSKTEPAEDLFDSFVRQIKSDAGSTLVFLKSRQDTVEQAFRLAAAVDWPEARGALRKLEEEEPSFLIRSLKQAMSRAVAFHNSDLSPDQRRVVEQAFIEKEVKVVFSTTTLAMGVNLAADTVYLETVKYSAGAYNRRPSLVPVTRSEFDNMTGRAGRLVPGGVRQPGRAIVLADNAFDREILWDAYIAPETAEPVRSAFLSMALVDWLLNMLVSTAGRAEITDIFRYSLYAASGGKLDASALDEALASLGENGFVSVNGDGRPGTPTALGRAIAGSGLAVEEAVHFLSKLESGRPDTEFGWTALALSSPGWILPPGILTRFEQRHNVPLKTLYQSNDALAGQASFLTGECGGRQALPYRTAASLKALLLLHDWCRLTPVQKLEEQYQMHLGQIMSLGDTAGHLVSALAAILEAGDSEAAVGTVLRNHAFSLRVGLPVSLRPLYERFGAILNRSDFLDLQRAGIDDLTGLTQLPAGALNGIIRGEHKLKLFNDKIVKLKEEVDMPLQSVAPPPRSAMMPPMRGLVPEAVEIDGSLEGERFLVRINGFPVRLTGKSFKYFVKLAWSRLNRDAGWIYKEDIEVGFNQARYLYRMKNEVNAGLNFAWPVVENNRLGYYRLNVDPCRIRVNLDNLKRHPDYEVRSMVVGVDAAVN